MKAPLTVRVAVVESLPPDCTVRLLQETAEPTYTESVPAMMTLWTADGMTPPCHVPELFQSPPPVPLLCTNEPALVKLAVTDLFAFMSTTLGFAVPDASPLQPVKM